MFSKDEVKLALNRIIKGIDAGYYDVVEIDCECGKGSHNVDAIYCTHCGKKLERTAANDTL